MTKKNIKVIALDLDGTVTEHRTKLEEDQKRYLDALSEKYHLVMVGAGGCKRIWNQMNNYPIDIIGNYGMEVMRYNKTDESVYFTHQVVIPFDKELILEKADYFREKTGFEEYHGDSVEFHDSGMLTFALLGTNAPIEKKLVFDRDRAKRRGHYNLALELFDDYTVFIGGTSSYDLVPQPYNKFYALSAYLDTLNLSLSEAVYFGDDYEKGGGDWHLKESEIEFIEVESHRKFPSLVEKFL